MLTKLLAKLFGNGLLLQALTALIRHALGAAGGYLLGLGLADKVVTQFLTSSEQVLVALAGIAAAYVMSVVNKRELL